MLQRHLRPCCLILESFNLEKFSLQVSEVIIRETPPVRLDMKTWLL